MSNPNSMGFALAYSFNVAARSAPHVLSSGPLSDPNSGTHLLPCRLADFNDATMCRGSNGILFRYWVHVRDIVRLHLAA